MAVWMYHPEEGARLFENPDDVPEGWADSPDFENANWIEVPESEKESEKEPVSKNKARKKKK